MKAELISCLMITVRSNSLMLPPRAELAKPTRKKGKLPPNACMISVQFGLW